MQRMSDMLTRWFEDRSRQNDGPAGPRRGQNEAAGNQTEADGSQPEADGSQTEADGAHTVASDTQTEVHGNETEAGERVQNESNETQNAERVRADNDSEQSPAESDVRQNEAAAASTQIGSVHQMDTDVIASHSRSSSGREAAGRLTEPIHDQSHINPPANGALPGESSRDISNSAQSDSDGKSDDRCANAKADRGDDHVIDTTEHVINTADHVPNTADHVDIGSDRVIDSSVMSDTTDHAVPALDGGPVHVNVGSDHVTEGMDHVTDDGRRVEAVIDLEYHTQGTSNSTIKVDWSESIMASDGGATGDQFLDDSLDGVSVESVIMDSDSNDNQQAPAESEERAVSPSNVVRAADDNAGFTSCTMTDTCPTDSAAVRPVVRVEDTSVNDGTSLYCNTK